MCNLFGVSLFVLVAIFVSQILQALGVSPVLFCYIYHCSHLVFMNLSVSFEVMCSRKALHTLITSIRSLSCMNLFMYIKVACLIETLITLVASIRSLSCVNSFVCL